MIAKETKSQKLIRYTEMLPEFCEAFLLETGTEKALSTRLSYAQELNCFFDFLINFCPEFCESNKNDFSIKELEQVTSQQISKYISLYQDSHAERTVARKRAALSSFFSYMVNNNRLKFNPVLAASRVKIHQTDEVLHLNIEEQVHFINAIESGEGLDVKKLTYHDRYKTRDVALIMLLLDTGIRVSELHGIDVEDIDFESASVLVTRKGGNHQTIYFSDETSGYLLNYLDERKADEAKSILTGPFFVTKQGARLSIRAIQVLVKKYSTASLPGKGSLMTPHKMRSSFAMEYYDSTKDILALQRKLGHKNLQTTNIYAKATEKKMAETRSILSQKRKNSTNLVPKYQSK